MNSALLEAIDAAIPEGTRDSVFLSLSPGHYVLCVGELRKLIRDALAYPEQREFDIERERCSIVNWLRSSFPNCGLAQSYADGIERLEHHRPTSPNGDG